MTIDTITDTVRVVVRDSARDAIKAGVCTLEDFELYLFKNVFRNSDQQQPYSDIIKTIWYEEYDREKLACTIQILDDVCRLEQTFRRLVVEEKRLTESEFDAFIKAIGYQRTKRKPSRLKHTS